MSGAESADAKRWLEYAEDDLRSAKVLLREGVPPRQVCFLAQQAAEKALKTLLVSRRIPFARTHDLLALRTLLPEPLEDLPDNGELAELTQWAAESRYPGDVPESGREDAEQALRIAEKTLRTVERTLGPT